MRARGERAKFAAFMLNSRARARPPSDFRSAVSGIRSLANYASVGMPHPFWITTALGGSDVNANAYSLGVTNHDASQARRMTALGGY